MKVLLLHPGIAPWDGCWAHETWDLVVDLGYASRDTYDEWSRKLGTRVLSIHEYVRGVESYRWVNEFFELGRGKLLDRMGLDWWELLSMESYQDLHVLYLCRILRSDINSTGVELGASNPHRLVRIAEQVFGTRAHYYKPGTGNTSRRLIRALRSARNLRSEQILEIAFDKWDAGLKVRRRWSKHKQVHLEDEAVLLPSAYSNVTRSVLAYAAQLPERRFLLVTTRSSAVPTQLPSNVSIAPLAAYAVSADAVEDEVAELRKGWESFLSTMACEQEEYKYAANAHLWDYVPAHLEQGVQIREAWRQVMDAEPLSGVLCGDDLNYHTRLPLVLAQRSHLRAIYCSHGALDGCFLFKQPFANCFLVKGKMEADYLLHIAGISREKILSAAPGQRPAAVRGGDAIVFFSQPFEVVNGRTDSIYQEVLPRLCSVAMRTGRKVIVKLHPFESKRARQKLVGSILGQNFEDVVEIVDGQPPEQVMSLAWCGVTVDSSVAVECALRKIPFFVCGWLDFAGMEYLRQYAQAGAARVLSSPNEIMRIPEMVAEHPDDELVPNRLWQPANSSQLDEILFGAKQASLDRCAC